jgi:hypothetical protein
MGATVVIITERQYSQQKNGGDVYISVVEMFSILLGHNTDL